MVRICTLGEFGCLYVAKKNIVCFNHMRDSFPFLIRLLHESPAKHTYGQFDGALKECFHVEQCALRKADSLKESNIRSWKLCLIASCGQEIAGCVNMANVYEIKQYVKYEFPSNALMLFNLCVSQNYREQRIGSRLVQECIVRAGTLPLYLTILRRSDIASEEDLDSLNENALKLLTFYHNKGFKTVRDCPSERYALLFYSP